jgi:hypothetical protein
LEYTLRHISGAKETKRSEKMKTHLNEGTRLRKIINLLPFSFALLYVAVIKHKDNVRLIAYNNVKRHIQTQI